MRKVLFFLSIVLLTVGMSSCGKGYDLDKCKEFQERIKAGDEFTDDEYAEIIEQAKGLLSFLDSTLDDYADLETGEEHEEYFKKIKAEEDAYKRLRNFLESKHHDFTYDNIKAYEEFDEARGEYRRHGNEVHLGVD